MALKTGFGKTKIFHDFTGVAVDATNDINAVGTTATIAINVQEGGACRLTSHTDSGDGARISSGLQWKAASGLAIMEARITQVTALLTRGFFIGFTDDATTEEIPISVSGVTYTGNAANSCGFVFDTTNATDGSSIYCVGSKASVCTAGTDSNKAIAAVGTWQVFRVAVDVDGNMVCWIDGVEVARIANAITASTAITPTVMIYTRSAAAKTMDVDYLYCEGGRAS